MTHGQLRARRVLRMPGRAPALLPATGAGLACGDATGPLRPADVIGTHTIQTSRGHALPWADTSSADPKASGWIVYGEQRTFRPDSVVVDVFRYATRPDFRVRADADAAGRWALNPPGLPPGSPPTVRISYYIPGDPGDPRTGRPQRPTQAFSVDYRVDAGGRRMQAASPSYYPDVWAR